MINIFSRFNFEEILQSDKFNIVKAERKFCKSKCTAELISKLVEKDKADALKYLYNKDIDLSITNKKSESILFNAIKHKSTLCINWILTNDIIDTNLENYNSLLPIHVAVLSQNLDIIDKVAMHTINLNRCDSNGENILFKAVKTKNIEVVKKVLSFGININSTDNNGNTIAHLPEFTHLLQHMEFFIEHDLLLRKQNKVGEDFYSLNILNFDINSEIFDRITSISFDPNFRYGADKTTLLKRLVGKGLSYNPDKLSSKKEALECKNRLMTLLKKGVDVNAKDDKGRTILFDIVEARNKEYLNILLTKTDAELNILDIDNKSLLDIAVFSEKVDLDIIKELLFSDIDCTLKTRDSHCVVEKLVDVILSENVGYRKRKIPDIEIFEHVNYHKIFSAVITHGNFNFNDITFNGDPIIFEIATSYYIPMLEKLYKLGVNFNIVSKLDGLNVLFRVLKNGENKRFKQNFLKMLKFLVSRDVSVDIKDDKGHNIIQRAILNHDINVINILSTRVRVFDSLDCRNRNYIHNAVCSGNMDAIRKFAALNPGLINAPDSYGVLPINYAVMFGKKDIVLLLLRLGSYSSNFHKINSKLKMLIESNTIDLYRILQTTMSEDEKKTITKVVDNMIFDFITKHKG